MTREDIFFAFAAIWIVLSTANILFHRRASLDVKRKWHGWIDFGLSFLFAAFGTYWAWGVETWGILLIWAVCIGGSYLFWRNVFFCAECGATVWPTGFGRVIECPKCKSAQCENTYAKEVTSLDNIS